MSLKTNLLKIQAFRKHRKLTRFFMNRILWYTGTPWTSLKPVRLSDLLPDLDERAPVITISNPLRRTLDTSLELDELCVLLTLVRYHKATNVLELGTWDGNTTLNLASNLPEHGRVTTIDLPLDEPAAGALLKPGEKLNITARNRVGEQYLDSACAPRITQVLGDSATLNWSELNGPFDFAFLDGCHTSAYVHSDTLNMLTCLKPGGVITWHDVDGAGAGTVMSAYAAAGLPVSWISGTRLGYCVFSDPAAARERIKNFAF